MVIEKFFRLVTVLLLMLVGTGVAQAAEDEQLYFIGMSAPLGSMSGEYATEDPDKSVVYLRWDVVEGSIPDDILEFRLYRDNEEMKSYPAHESMTAAEIKALYAGIGQERRRAEIIDWLDKEQSVTSVDESNFHTFIEDKLLNDSFWALFASRIDFNIARARYRGFIDDKVTRNETYTYELRAFNGSKEELVGRVVVTAGTTQQLDSASGFEQVFGISRCDAPERFKEHGALYLNWLTPGSNALSQYANNLAIAGYDLYRTESGWAADRDIRSEAMSATVDSDGKPVIEGLVKVTDQPIIMSGTKEAETRHEGWNAPYAQYMELPKKLREQGIMPGDRLSYYLVPRDFTGNYGQTVRINVTIPDLTPPPAPWSVWTVPDSGSGTFKLVWLKTDVRNYHDQYRRGRQFCNLETARMDRKLSFVLAGQQCEANAQQEVSLDPTEYLIYRFESVEEARRFKDSDGDGYSDLDERVVNPDNALLTSTGTACDYDDVMPWTNYLEDEHYPAGRIVAATASRMQNGKAVLEFVDAVPAANKNKLYWYRIATRDHNGQISSLSAPIRGFFPALTIPDRSGIRDGVKIGVPTCTYSIQEKTDTPSPFALDDTTDAEFFTVYDDKDTNLAVFDLEYDLHAATSKSAEMGQKICERVASQCKSGCGVRFLRGDGTALDEARIEAMSCPMTRRYVLSKTCASSTFNDINDSFIGGVVEPPLYIAFNPAVIGDNCVKLYREIDGESYLVKSYCPPFPPGPVEMNVTSIGNAETCFSASVADDEAQTSLRLAQSCVMVLSQQPPSAPLAAEIKVDSASTRATLNWVPPRQEIVGTMLEWYSVGTDENASRHYFTQFVDAQAREIDGLQTADVDITPPPSEAGWSEQWCFRARTVAAGGSNPQAALSPWSEETCVLRKDEAAPLPQYLEWPSVPAPGMIGTVKAFYLTTDQYPVIVLSDALTPSSCVSQQIPDCDPGSTTACDQDGTNIGSDCDTLCSTMRSAASGHLGFVLYRQSAANPADPGTHGSYYQVSPLVDRINCKSGSSIFDPFILIANIQNVDPETANGYRVMYKDRYPHEGGRYYRYQLVYFDEKSEISGYRTSNWVEAK